MLVRATLPLLLLPALAGAALPVHEVTEVSFLGGGIADSFRGRIQGRRHALKPLERFGESDFGSFGQGNPEGELVSLPLLRRLGLVAPEPLLFRPGPAAPPVLGVSWVDEELAGGPVRPAQGYLRGPEALETADRDAFALMFAADALIGNSDRHGGNYFLREAADGSLHPVPIDHNLALFPPEVRDWNPTPEVVRPQDLDRSAAMAGRLADAPDWGERFLAALRRVHQALPPEVLTGLVEALPETIPAARRGELERILRARHAGLVAAGEAWREGWRAPPALPDELPELPPQLQFLGAWAPRRVAAVLWFFQGYLEGAPELAAPAAAWLQLPEGTDLASWVAEQLPVWAPLFDPAWAEQARAGNLTWGRTIAATFRAGVAVLVERGGLAPEEATRRLRQNLLRSAVFQGQVHLPSVYEILLRGRAASPWTCLAAALAMGEALEGGGFPARLGRLRPLLEASRHLLHDLADESALRLRAKAALLGPFAGLLRELLPEALPSALEAGLLEVLRERPRGALRLTAGRAEPRSLALALGTAAAELPHERRWAHLLEHSSLEGAWLAGRRGPVDADDPGLSVDLLVAQGFSQDAAARLLFERLAHGAYRGPAGVRARLGDAEVLEHLVDPAASLPPPWPADHP